jgi:methyl-accepting chemotaxis protein
MSKTILVNILILFFIILIGYQIILANHIVEGLENNTTTATNANATNANTYTPYDTNNPDNALILSQKNAGNIDYLKQRIDNVQDIFQEVQDLSANVSALQDQVNGIVSAQADYATQMTGGTTPVITGAINEDDEEDTTTLETTS